jgi:hypothetical protein
MSLRATRLYSTAIDTDLPLTGVDIANLDRRRNEQMGLWQLAREREVVLSRLHELQEMILNGEPVPLG